MVILKLLLRDIQLDFALRKASEFGDLELVKLLLEAGADIHSWHDYSLRYAHVTVI